MELTYTKVGDYNLPNLTLPVEPEVHLGRYARMRKKYLMEHRKGTFTTLLTTGKLTAHLMDVEQTASEMIDRIVQQMAKTEGVTEDLKMSDPLRWTGLMNNLRHSAEETVLQDLIYS